MWVLAQLFKFLHLAILILTFFFSNSRILWKIGFGFMYTLHNSQDQILYIYIYICQVLEQISYKYGVLQLIKTNHLPL
jgi:hypothetical protein